MILIKYGIGLVLIGLVVFIHELGHFFVARLLKVDVECLSYGMGPKIWSYQGKKTEYAISLLPFGGYCRMKGSIDLTRALHDEKDSIEKSEKGSYFSANALTRLVIYAAGPFMNFLLAVCLLAMASGLPVERISNPAIVAPISEYPEVFNVDIRQDAIEKGDQILTLNGKDVRDYQDFTLHLPKDGTSAEVTVLRDGQILPLTLSPTRFNDGYSFGLTLMQKPVIAIPDDDILQEGDLITHVDGIPVETTLDFNSLVEMGSTLRIERENGDVLYYDIEKVSPLPFAWKSDIVKSADDIGVKGPLVHGLHRASEYFVTTLKALGALVTFNFEDARDIIVGPMKASYSISDISVKAFTVSHQSGFRSLAYLLSIVSISLCVGNVLPIPTFDGGGMLISLVEMIKGSNLKPKMYVILQIFGMVCALAIIIYMYSLDAVTILKKLR